jgi:hypothetical protein
MGQVQAKSAYQFFDSVGVVVHFDGQPASKYIDMLKAIGVKHIRTGTPGGGVLGTYNAVAAAGGKFCLFECNVYNENNQVNAWNDVALAQTFEQQSPGAVFAMEGCNEYDFWHYMLNDEDSYQNYGDWGPNDAEQLKQAMQDSNIAHADRVSPSVQQIHKMPNYGSSITMSNSHAYNPEMGGNIQHHIKAGIDYAKAYAPGLPVCITETGCSSGGYINGGYSTGTQRTQEIIVLNAVLEGFANGAFRTYLYELNSWSGASGAVEQNFGVFETNGTPKPAATSLGNLMYVCGEGTAFFTSNGLDYEIDGLPETASHILLQKSDGAFLIVLWDGGCDISDGSQDVEPEPSDVIVTFATVQKVINIYDPCQSRAPRTTSSDVSQVTVELGATPLVIETLMVLQEGMAYSVSETILHEY